MLSAKDEEIDKILGLELGADDYVTKPFSVRELMARVKANLRKVEVVSNNNNLNMQKEDKKKDNKIEVGELELDLDKFEVKVRGEIIDLTLREFEVLKHLVLGKSNTEIAKELIVSVHTAKAHVCSILQKMCVNDRVQAAVKAVKEGMV